MTLAPAPFRPVTPPARGRHRGGDDTSSTALADLLAQAQAQAPGTDETPRVAGAHRSAAGPSFSRAARTAGLSLAALGALATAGGVATQGLGADDAPSTGALAPDARLAAADLALEPAPAPSPAAVAAPAVLPAAAPRTASTTSEPATTTAAPETTTVSVSKASSSDDDDEDEDEDSSSSSAASEAVAAAKAQVGKPYKWGATGPSSFDCSGLTSWAYKQAGVSLPRTSSAQSKAGTKVSLDSLQPGDLVFFYSPVSHVAMYIGNGKMVEAPSSGSDVRIRSLSGRDPVSARRFG